MVCTKEGIKSGCHTDHLMLKSWNVPLTEVKELQEVRMVQNKVIMVIIIVKWYSCSWVDRLEGWRSMFSRWVFFSSTWEKQRITLGLEERGKKIEALLLLLWQVMTAPCSHCSLWLEGEMLAPHQELFRTLFSPRKALSQNYSWVTSINPDVLQHKIIKKVQWK